MNPGTILIANLFILGLNLIVLGFSLKLFTEYVKDKSMDKRMKKEKLPALCPVCHTEECICPP